MDFNAIIFMFGRGQFKVGVVVILRFEDANKSKICFLF